MREYYTALKRARMSINRCRVKYRTGAVPLNYIHQGIVLSDKEEKRRTEYLVS
jgi:hypothetical protein